MTERSTFRPDVEGLRALAVASVLAFHIGTGAIASGGFVGVDVFFVISGFLITGNILPSAFAGQFRFGDFYVRRFRRLFPALFCTVALTVAIAAVLSSPRELLHTAQSAIASMFSVSNFYFLNQAGYFDQAAIQKPLLHTWSLAVEEQFYLVWPLIIVMLTRYLRGWQPVSALVTLAIISIWAAERALASNPAAAFYLAPYRVGEFCLGAICAWLPARRLASMLTADLLALLGLLLVLVPVFAYSGTIRFPGLTALVPCAGAALLIQFGNSRVARVLLANRLAVGVGRISYSLYLAHWPVTVFWLQRRGQPGIADTVAVGVISLVGALAMYRFVEQPFRIRVSQSGAYEAPVSTGDFMKRFAALSVGLLAATGLIWWGQGWAWRFPPHLSRLAAEAEGEKTARFDLYQSRCLAANRASCDAPADGVNVMIVGDSHGPDAFNALGSQYPEYHYVLRSVPGCAPLVREDYGLLTPAHPGRDACIAMNETLLHSDQLSRTDLVVINAVFQWFRPEHLSRTVAEIHRKTKAPIVVLGNYLFFDEDVPDMVIRHGSTTMDSFYEHRLASHSLEFEAELEELAARQDFTYVSKRRMFCKGGSTLDCALMFGKKLFTYDRHHLSVAASDAMGAALRAEYGWLFGGLGATNAATELGPQTNLGSRH